MEFNVGDKVRIDKCDQCLAIIGKVAKISGFSEFGNVFLNFGKGRPQLNRPNYFCVENISLIQEKGSGNVQDIIA